MRYLLFFKCFIILMATEQIYIYIYIYDFIDLVDDVLDENNPFNNKIKTEDIYIEDNLFDDTHSQIDQDVLTKWTKKNNNSKPK